MKEYDIYPYERDEAYRTGKKNADALKHLVQDEILEVIEGDDTKIEAVEF